MSPDTSEIFEITLVRNAASEPSTRTVHRVPEPNGEISLGRVEAGDELRLAVELRSPNQRLIGYGRSQAGQDVAPGDSLTLPMHVRKPFLYLTGDSAITTLDPTIDGSTDNVGYLGRIDALAQPLVTGTSSDGSALHVVHGSAGAYQLTVLSTANHADSLFGPIALAQAPTDVAASADGRYVAIGHADGLSVVDTTRAGEEVGAITPAAISGAVARIAVSPGARPTAYALLDNDTECGGASRVVAFDLDDPQTALAELTVTGPATDLAVLAGGAGQPEVLVARTCESDILAGTMITADTPTTAPFASVPGISALAVLDDRIWAVGSASSAIGAYLVAVSLDSSGAEQSYAEMPVLQERVVTDEFSGESDEAVRQMDAIRVAAVHMGVVPGGDAIALTVQADYYAPDRWAEVLGIDVMILPELEVRDREFLLLDVATSTVVRRLRTACELKILSLGHLVGGWTCGQLPDQDVVQSPFAPTSLSILYGAN